jgi:hypothetical protein
MTIGTRDETRPMVNAHGTPGYLVERPETMMPARALTSTGPTVRVVRLP